MNNPRRGANGKIDFFPAADFVKQEIITKLVQDFSGQGICFFWYITSYLREKVSCYD